MGINQGKATAICLFNIDNGSLAEAQLSSKIISLISVGSLARGEACEHVNAGWRRKCVFMFVCVGHSNLLVWSGSEKRKCKCGLDVHVRVVRVFAFF